MSDSFLYLGCNGTILNTEVNMMLTRKFVYGLFEAFAIVGFVQTVVWLIMLFFNFSWLSLIAFVGYLATITYIAIKRADNK